MVIENNRVVSLTYELRLKNEDGKIAENVDSGSPFVFLFGHGNLLPEFESKISGMKVGDSFSFKLMPDEAYGMISDEAIVELPISIFNSDGEDASNLLQIGNSIPMMDNEGNRLNGKVVSVEGETVTMDFNHPLAGEVLFFKGEVMEIREASETELQHGHIHEHGHHHAHHGSCDSGGCEPTPGCGCGH